MLFEASLFFTDHLAAHLVYRIWLFISNLLHINHLHTSLKDAFVGHHRGNGHGKESLNSIQALF
jgi:hypothetical protein